MQPLHQTADQARWCLHVHTFSQVSRDPAIALLDGVSREDI
jgi:hypothetical protein